LLQPRSPSLLPIRCYRWLRKRPNETVLGALRARMAALDPGRRKTLSAVNLQISAKGELFAGVRQTVNFGSSSARGSSASSRHGYVEMSHLGREQGALGTC
jgi:hypothetical protein